MGGVQVCWGPMEQIPVRSMSLCRRRSWCCLSKSDFFFYLFPIPQTELKPFRPAAFSFGGGKKVLLLAFPSESGNFLSHPGREGNKISLAQCLSAFHIDYAAAGRALPFASPNPDFI